MLKAGSAAPLFEARDQNRDPIRLADLRGSWVVLYFYPKDEAAGCTAEACTFLDEMADFMELGRRSWGCPPKAWNPIGPSPTITP